MISRVVKLRLFVSLMIYVIGLPYTFSRKIPDRSSLEEFDLSHLHAEVVGEEAGPWSLELVKGDTLFRAPRIDLAAAITLKNAQFETPNRTVALIAANPIYLGRFFGRPARDYRIFEFRMQNLILVSYQDTVEKMRIDRIQAAVIFTALWGFLVYIWIKRGEKRRQFAIHKMKRPNQTPEPTAPNGRGSP